MTDYRVKTDCFFNGHRYRKGAIVSLADKPNKHFEAVKSAKADAPEKPSFSAIHKGNGKWSVVNDVTGEEIETGLEKFEAQTRVEDLLTAPEA